MQIDILTLFPAMFLGPFQESILKRAQQQGILLILLHQLRDYAFDRHQMTDDAPYGGGKGMVMKPEPIFNAVESILDGEQAPIILMTPQGQRFDQKAAIELAQYPRLLFICGHYEGVDERVRAHLVTDEYSIGDYVLTGGELAAMVMVDAITRFVPGVLGALESALQDSYVSGLLEGPQYTRPSDFRGWAVPEVLRSGNHAAIAQWQHQQALCRTFRRRPDLFAQMALTEQDRTFIAKIRSNLGEPNAE